MKVNWILIGVAFLSGAAVTNCGAQRRMDAMPCSASVAEVAPWIIKEAPKVKGPIAKIEDGIKEARAKASAAAQQEKTGNEHLVLPGMENYKQPDEHAFDRWMRESKERRVKEAASR